MPTPVSATTIEQAQRLESIDPFLWLYEVEVPTTPETRYRFVGQFPEQITFRTNIYYPFPVSHSVTTETTEGDLSETTLTVTNITKEILTKLELHNGFIGQPVRIMLINRLDLGSGERSL